MIFLQSTKKILFAARYDAIFGWFSVPFNKWHPLPEKEFYVGILWLFQVSLSSCIPSRFLALEMGSRLLWRRNISVALPHTLLTTNLGFYKWPISVSTEDQF